MIFSASIESEFYTKPVRENRFEKKILGETCGTQLTAILYGWLTCMYCDKITKRIILHDLNKQYNIITHNMLWFRTSKFYDWMHTSATTPRSSSWTLQLVHSGNGLHQTSPQRRHLPSVETRRFVVVEKRKKFDDSIRRKSTARPKHFEDFEQWHCDLFTYADINGCRVMIYLIYTFAQDCTFCCMLVNSWFDFAVFIFFDVFLLNFHLFPNSLSSGRAQHLLSGSKGYSIPFLQNQHGRLRHMYALVGIRKYLPNTELECELLRHVQIIPSAIMTDELCLLGFSEI